MTERGARSILWVLALVEIDNTLHVHPLVSQDDAILLARDRHWRAGRAPNTADRDRIAAISRVILEGVVFGDGRLTRLRQELHHRLLAAGAAVGHGREQPRAGDIATCYLARRT